MLGKVQMRRHYFFNFEIFYKLHFLSPDLLLPEFFIKLVSIFKDENIMCLSIVLIVAEVINIDLLLINT